MTITPIKRPWEKKQSQGTRYNPDPFYQSQEWKNTKIRHKQGFTVVNGKAISNMNCIPCYRDTGQTVPMFAVDHITPIKAGGSRTDPSNLESQCARHHAQKSANEGKTSPRT